MIYLVSSYSIKQTIITDCSFVSSLVIAAAYERTFRKQLITKIIFPQDRNGIPIYNPAGKYLVKLNFNGIVRKIVVDDRLPLSRDGQLMCSHTTQLGELWVSIIEKAFLKVNGGYDFPGSNSGIDMFALTGWIPEQFRTGGSDDFNPARLWERMLSASQYGDCLLTVATGPLTAQQEESLGLVPTHAYAVMQVRDVRGVKLLQLKNPWCTVRWKGAFSHEDSKRWTPELREALQFDPTSAAQFDNGVFWIDYPSLLSFFHGVYLNWNPRLFRHHTATHAQWPRRTPASHGDDAMTLGANPQYALTVKIGAEQLGGAKSAAVWLLLSRHTVSATQSKDDFLTVHVFKNRGGFRVYYLEECWLQGVYSNKPHTLVKFDLPLGTHQLTLALAQYKAVDHQVDYTLDIYSMAPFSARLLPFQMRHSERLTSEWRGRSAGGSPQHDSFPDNPRFQLRLEQSADLAISLELAPPHTHSVGLELHPHAAKGYEPLCASGAYRSGFCLLEARALAAGTYTVVASTYSPSEEGRFTLGVGSSQPVKLRALANEVAGLHEQVVRGVWSFGGGSAAGSSNHGQFARNPHVRLRLERTSDILLRLRIPKASSSRPATRPALGLDIFAQDGRLGASSLRQHARLSAHGGVYAYPPGGTCVARTSLEAGTYVAVVSTFAPFEGPFELLVYAAEGALRLEAI